MAVRLPTPAGTFPVYLRVGDGEETHVGQLTLEAGELDGRDLRSALATALRSAADAFDRTDSEE